MPTVKKTMPNLLIFRTTLLVLSLVASLSQASPVVIAHRGASGYLPEHSIAAKTLAFAQNADYIEQDLVMTKDNEVVVLHDRFLDRVTDVAKKFPERARPDGRFYVIDFTLSELRTLDMTNGFTLNPASGANEAEWPNRFATFKSRFSIHTFAEEIELIQELNRLFNKNVGIYPEIKSPWFHRQEGKDISRYVLAILKDYGYQNQASKVFLQCFDPNELIRIDSKLQPQMGMDLKLVQLVAETSWNETYEINAQGQWQPYNYDWMFEAGAMKIISSYAEGVGPWKPFVIKPESTPGNIQITNLVSEAHKYQLKVHPYTFRADDGRVASWAESFEDMIRVYVRQAKVDGIFTDFPDRARAALD